MMGDALRTPGACSLLVEPAAVYHARSREFLSSHALRDFRKCPLLFRRKQLGLVPEEDSDAYFVGRAGHTLVLEGPRVFEEQYAVGGPINPKTGRPFGDETKAFAAWAAQFGKPVLTEAQYAQVLAMAQSVQAHDEAARLLASGVPERVVRTGYCGVDCQIRMDWFEPDEGITDLKTCDDLTWFEADARRFGYPHQLAFYQSVLARAIGRSVPVHVIAVEKKEPHRTGVWRLSAECLARARRDNETAIADLLVCQRSDRWPTRYEAIRTLDAA